MGWLVRRDGGANPDEAGAGAKAPTIIPFDDGFDYPAKVKDTEVAFGSNLLEGGLLPVWSSIPSEFRVGRGRGRARVWRTFQHEWLYRGLSAEAVKPREGIDWDDAWRHLAVIQRSWEPTPEHKAAAVAWLASRWFVFADPVLITPERVSYTG